MQCGSLKQHNRLTIQSFAIIHIFSLDTMHCSFQPNVDHNMLQYYCSISIQYYRYTITITITTWYQNPSSFSPHLPPNSSCQMYIFWHDGDSLCMDGTNVTIL